MHHPSQHEVRISAQKAEACTGEERFQGLIGGLIRDSCIRNSGKERLGMLCPRYT